MPTAAPPFPSLSLSRPDLLHPVSDEIRLSWTTSDISAGYRYVEVDLAGNSRRERTVLIMPGGNRR